MDPSVIFTPLEVAGVTPDSVSIRWTSKIKGISKSRVSFSVFVKGEMADGDPLHWVDAPEKDSCTITGLKEGTKYEFFVVASDSETEEEFNTEPAGDDGLVVTTPVNDVEPPTVSSKRLTASNIDDQGFTLKWTKAEDKVTDKTKIIYRVFYLEAGDPAAAWKVAENARDIGSYRFDNLKSGTQYLLYVEAVDEAGNICRYPAGEDTTKKVKTKGLVQDIYGRKMTARTQDSITVEWDKASTNPKREKDIRYDIRLLEGRDLECQSLQDVKGYAYTFKGLKPFTYYSFSIKAIHKDGSTSDYAPLTVSTTDSEAPKANPRSVTTETTTDSITLHWEEATDNATVHEKIRYDVKWRESGDSGDTWHTIHAGKGISSYTLTGLKESTNYSLLVKAYDEAGNELLYADSESGMAFFAKTGSTDTEAPTVEDRSLTCTYEDMESVTIQWDPATDNKTEKDKIRYEVWFLPPMGEPNRYWKRVKADTGFYSYTFTGLKPDTYYDCYVRAIDKADNAIQYPRENGSIGIQTTKPEEWRKMECVQCYNNASASFSIFIPASFNRFRFGISFDFSRELDTTPIITLDSLKCSLNIHLINGYVHVSLNGGKKSISTSIYSKPKEWQHIDLMYQKGVLTVNGKSFQVGELEGVYGGNNLLSSKDFVNETSFKGFIKNVVVNSY